MKKDTQSHKIRNYWMQNNDIAAVVDHLGSGVDINAVDEWGWTLLMCAVSWMKDDIAELLINRGADVNISGQHGMTALHLAAQIGNPKISKLLIAAGADVNAVVTPGNKSPLAYAEESGAIAQKETFEIIKFAGGKFQLPEESIQLFLSDDVQSALKEAPEDIREMLGCNGPTKDQPKLH